jgi:hypothetical protein
LWEQGGHPEGKDLEYYFRAKKIVGEREASQVIELAAPKPKAELEMSPPIPELAPPQPGKHKGRKKR